MIKATASTVMTARAPLHGRPPTQDHLGQAQSEINLWRRTRRVNVRRRAAGSAHLTAGGEDDRPAFHTSARSPPQSADRNAPGTSASDHGRRAERCQTWTHSSRRNAPPPTTPPYSDHPHSTTRTRRRPSYCAASWSTRVAAGTGSTSSRSPTEGTGQRRRPPQPRGPSVRPAGQRAAHGHAADRAVCARLAVRRTRRGARPGMIMSAGGPLARLPPDALMRGTATRPGSARPAPCGSARRFGWQAAAPTGGCRNGRS
jgi:hypothetical protein